MKNDGLFIPCDLLTRNLAQALEDARGDRRAECVVINTIARIMDDLGSVNTNCFDRDQFRKDTGLAVLGATPHA